MNVVSNVLMSDDEARWRTILRRDAEFDGVFVFAVTSTGIYCRPSCPSRRPNRDNVLFFDLNRDAETAGFRPCKRCEPTDLSASQKQNAAIEHACREIERAPEAMSVDRLASYSNLSSSWFRRQFKAVTGTTPKAYAKAIVERNAAEALAGPSNRSVTDAAFAAGYSSMSRFYDGAAMRLGMRPRDFRAGGAGQVIRYGFAETEFGQVLVAATPSGVCAVRFGDDQATLAEEVRREFPEADVRDGGDTFEEIVGRVVGAIHQPEAAEDLPLDIRGTLFEQKVWAALREIPLGETRSYADVAESIGQPTATRAVARACAANPLAVLTPCHRVVAKSGAASGYRWGRKRKEALLEKEAKRHGR